MRFEVTNLNKINWTSKGTNRVLQNVVNLLNLARYEVPYDRTRGLDLSTLDLPANEASEIIKADIIELIAEYEPRAAIVDADVSFDNMGDVILKVVVEID